MKSYKHSSRVLMTGFSPFGNSSVNPSWEAVKQVQTDKDVELIRLEIPTVFYKSARILEECIEETRPDIVLCIGQAAGRAEITPERIAININDASVPDNEGNMPRNEFISQDGAPAYFTGLDVDKIVEALQLESIPARISFSAGTYVCNHLFYSLMDFIWRNDLPIIGGFVHIPCIPEQIGSDFSVKTPSLPLDVIVHGLECILHICLNKDSITTPPEGR